MVQAAEAQVLSAKAWVRKAELDLSFTKMTAHETESGRRTGLEKRSSWFFAKALQRGHLGGTDTEGFTVIHREVRRIRYRICTAKRQP
jgi:hypothetical protein